MFHHVYYFGFPWLLFLARPEIIASIVLVTATVGGYVLNQLPGYLQRRQIEQALKEDRGQVDNTPTTQDTWVNPIPTPTKVKPNGTKTGRDSGINSQVVKFVPSPQYEPGQGEGEGTETETGGGGGTNTKSPPTSGDWDVTRSGTTLVVNTGRTSLSYEIPIAISGVLPPFNNPIQVPNPFSFQSDNPAVNEQLDEIQQQIKPFPTRPEIEGFTTKHPPDSNTPADTPVLINPPSSGYIPKNPIPRPKHTWIMASHSTFSKTKGRTIKPPVTNLIEDWVGTPVTDEGFNPTALNAIMDQYSNPDKFIEYQVKSSQGQITPTDEENLDLSEVAVTFMPKFFNPLAPVIPLFGVGAIVKLAEAFQIYSDTAVSNVQFNAPLKINYKEWRGADPNKNPGYDPAIKEYLKPQDPAFQDKVKDATLVNNGATAEIPTEQLLQYRGNLSLYQGGETQQNTEFNNIDDFLNNPYLRSPDVNKILNEGYNPSTGQYTDGSPPTPPLNNGTPTKLKAKSQLDVVQDMLGVIYAKLGLDQFPAEVPSLKDPPYVTDSEDRRIFTEPRKNIKLPNMTAGMAYGFANLDKNIGKFPIEIETDSRDLEPDPNNPNATQPKKSHSYMENLSQATSNIMALGMVTAAIGQFNMNMGLKNTRTLTETRSAAIKSMNCSCAMVDFAGGNNNPAERCVNTQWNLRDAKGFNDMATPKADQCDVGMQNTDNTTLKKMLTDILWGVNIIKGAFFKGNKELDDQVKSIREINKEIKEKDKKFADFVDDFNKEKDPLTKDGVYPIKPKIIVEQKPNNPPNQQNP